MSDVYFKASLQNTLNPEVGTFDNKDKKEGIFTLEDGEYYLTNNTGKSYRVYYPTKHLYSVGFTIEFDVNYSDIGNNSFGIGNFGWCLGFNGDESNYWHGFGVFGKTLQFRGQTLPNYDIATSPSTWLHVKCTFNYDYEFNRNDVHIYVDDVEVNNFTISNKYDIKYIDILGNSGGYVPDGAKIKNIIIYNNKKQYLDTTGLTLLWSKIKSLFATKTELASKANTSDLSNYYTKSEIDSITIYDLVPDGAANHRNFYRGKDLTAAFDSGEFSTHVADGSFHDIFPGDYITESITVPQILKADGTTEYIAQKTYTVNFVIADLDIWLNHGYPATMEHHVAIVPQSVIFNSCMNETNTTTGGYKGSFMNKTVMPAFGEALRNAFGNDHILQFTFFDTNAVDNNLKSGGIVNFTGATYWGNNGHDWASHYCHLMTETMVYGAPIAASCAADEIMGGVQMAAFRLNSNLFYNGQVYWLSDVVSSAYFARFGFVGGGGVGADSASLSLGVRPFALLV